MDILSQSTDIVLYSVTIYCVVCEFVLNYFLRDCDN